MRFREIFRYELGYRLRAPSTWIYFGLMYLGPLVMVQFSSTENDRVVNAPVHYAASVSILGFFALVITAGIFSDAATRDADTRMQALFSTTPITKLDYLGGRFAASYLVNAVLFAGMPLMVALSMTFPWLSHFNWAPFRVMAFVQPYVLMTLPNLFIGAAVIFTIAALTKNSLATYLGGLGLGILYLIVINQGLGNDTLENLIDPFGIGPLQKVTSYWPPSEQTTRLIGFPGVVVLNRALWMGLAVALLVFLYSRFSFSHPGVGARRRSVQMPGEEGDERLSHAIASVPRARREFGARTRVAQLMKVARHALLDIVRNRVFLVMVLGTVVLASMVGWEVGAIVFDTATWPVTHLIAGSLHGFLISTVMIVVISLVAGELIWKERDVGAGDITAAAPVPDWIPLIGRFLALIAVLLTLQALYTVSGIALQAIQGYYRFELGLYVRMMFGLQLIDYIILAALAMAAHVVVNHKNLGHVVVIGTYLFTLVAGSFFRIRHNLLVFNGDPGWTYSDLNGFGPFMWPFLWFKSYWAAWAILLTVVATVFWVRSTEGGWRARVRLARLRLDGAASRAAVVAALLIVTTGGFVFYNTNVVNEYRSLEEGTARRVEYERRYKRYEHVPQPTVVANNLRVELYPARPAADISGGFQLVNATSRPIDSIHVTINPDVDVRALSFDRVNRLVLDDSTLHQRVYVLDRPLQPADTMRMTFEVVFQPRGFTNAGQPTDVVSNGTYFDRDWLPGFGYRPTRELPNDRERERYGLPPKAEPPSPKDTTLAARGALMDGGSSYVQTDVTIGTDEDQIAITPGLLVREWREGGRRYFRYVTDKPVLHSVPVLSARYEVRGDAWKGIPLRIYYHPTHTFNLDRMVSSMKASLDYYSAAFGPYPYRELRVVEFPRYASFARANPYTITFSEGSAFITRIEGDDVDRTFFVVAHETAHQWWGNLVRGARMKGGALVSETLAQYSAMMVMEKTYGPDMVRRFYGFEMERYLRGRGQFASREAPMSEVESQSHLYYHKGAVVMYTLREMIGEAQVNLALRRFLEAHDDSRPPYATSLDLLKELRAVTPDSLQYLMTDLFDTVTLWDVKTDSATAEQTESGDWRVTVTVTAKKVRADSVGKETEVPMSDLVDIGVFAAPKQGKGLDEAIYLQKHWVRSGQQTITVTVPGDPARVPARAGIDPRHKLIERETGAATLPIVRRAEAGRTP